jgi:hypothetical protein
VLPGEQTNVLLAALAIALLLGHAINKPMKEGSPNRIIRIYEIQKRGMLSFQPPVDLGVFRGLPQPSSGHRGLSEDEKGVRTVTYPNLLMHEFDGGIVGYADILAARIGGTVVDPLIRRQEKNF